VPEAELREDSDVVGDEGSDGYSFVGKGRLRVT
jgi:hypothetical protein